MAKPTRFRVDNREASALKTPSDLSADATQSIANALNGLVADAYALYVKTKNFHWHMSGAHFRDYHLLLDEQGDQIFESIDPLAERVRKLGKTTLRSIGQISKLASIADNDSEFVAPLDMLSQLMSDNKQMCASMRKAHELCDKYGDAGTAGLLEQYIDETERRTWFLFETTRAGGETAK